MRSSAAENAAAGASLDATGPAAMCEHFPAKVGSDERAARRHQHAKEEQRRQFKDDRADEGPGIARRQLRRDPRYQFDPKTFDIVP